MMFGGGAVSLCGIHLGFDGFGVRLFRHFYSSGSPSDAARR
jgi:hypothetical protein